VENGAWFPLARPSEVVNTHGLNHQAPFPLTFHFLYIHRFSGWQFIMLSTYLLVLAEIISSTLKMEAICSSETSVVTQQTTRRHIPEDDTLQCLKKLANLRDATISVNLSHFPFHSTSLLISEDTLTSDNHFPSLLNPLHSYQAIPSCFFITITPDILVYPVSFHSVNSLIHFDVSGEPSRCKPLRVVMSGWTMDNTRTVTWCE
jgi:succinate dehydrogenase/fumarate reductase cytochrome b subunit